MFDRSLTDAWALRGWCLPGSAQYLILATYMFDSINLKFTV